MTQVVTLKTKNEPVVFVLTYFLFVFLQMRRAFCRSELWKITGTSTIPPPSTSGPETWSRWGARALTCQLRGCRWSHGKLQLIKQNTFICVWDVTSVRPTFSFFKCSMKSQSRLRGRRRQVRTSCMKVACVTPSSVRMISYELTTDLSHFLWVSHAGEQSRRCRGDAGMRPRVETCVQC